MANIPFVVTVSARAARAHAQKNCLSVVVAVAALVTPELSVKSRGRMDRLRSAACHMAELLDDDLSESTEAPAAIGCTEVDVNALFDDVCDLLRDRAEAAHVALVVNCAGGVLFGDKARLREALFNIIANALEAAPRGRTVFVRTAVTPEGDHEWTVEDSGAGMGAEVVHLLGVPHRSFRRGGSGLGIALARAIVGAHGGAIRFESARGCGTRVTISLPRTRRDHPSARAVDACAEFASDA
jgi:two-component system sensor histidine kinase HydH